MIVFLQKTWKTVYVLRVIGEGGGAITQTSNTCVQYSTVHVYSMVQLYSISQYTVPS